MGHLKDALFLEVWRHLQSLPFGRTLLTSLNSPLHGPQAIRAAWSELQANGRLEGMKKKTGLQAVLAERSDLFGFTTTEKGHLLIELTELAKNTNPVEGLPPAPTGAAAAAAVAALPQGFFTDFDLASAAASAMLEEQLASMAEAETDTSFSDMAGATGPEPIVPAMPAGLVAGTAVPTVASSFAGVAPASAAPPPAVAVEEPLPGFQGWPMDFGYGMGEMCMQPPVMVDPDGPSARRQRAFAYAAGWRGKGRGKSGYFMDLIWTPAIMMSREAERRKESEMARALFNALEMHGGQSVTLSQIGSDFKVAQMKKDPMFKNIRLLDILRQYEDVFELTPDNLTGGWTVRLQPGAQAALPDAEAMIEQELRETDLMLPDRIENPTGAKEKMQALRIELLHALSRRGGRVPLQELGQEPRVQQRKQGLHQAKKLVDFLRLFPENFRVVADDMQMIVETASTNVGDLSMIDQSIYKNQQAMNQLSSKGGKGGKSGRGRHFSSPYPAAMMPQFGQQVWGFGGAGPQGRSPGAAVSSAALAAMLQGAVPATGFFTPPPVQPL